MTESFVTAIVLRFGPLDNARDTPLPLLLLRLLLLLLLHLLLLLLLLLLSLFVVVVVVVVAAVVVVGSVGAGAPVGVAAVDVTVKMDQDVEVEIEPTDSECGSLEYGHLHSTPSFQTSAFSSGSRRTSFELDVRKIVVGNAAVCVIFCWFSLKYNMACDSWTFRTNL